ncbi:STAS-like domain-containing protein [Anthocerotibacter panamensis]|uniref:STAS-like domain-containing protein n=1 Tax=Anthocerotibacter panamensis TaxID=2857077 RepID=UPI001C407D05|nr:DUF4325 domain-containing protein [Anthocerotibacter panamensis]
MSPDASEIKRFLIQQISKNPREVARTACEKFGVSRQAINRHLQQLTQENIITGQGSTKSKEYFLVSMNKERIVLAISPELQEDIIWSNRIKPLLHGVPDHILQICAYGFTEILNNVIDHSEGNSVAIQIEYTPVSIQISILDNGVGIFKKIQQAFNLPEEHFAMLELAKGKVTTDPKNHTGEGIFFSSRMFDNFAIFSGRLFFKHSIGDREDWLLEDAKEKQGTFVYMEIDPNSKRTSKEIFLQYTSEEDNFAFTKTCVPVILARYGDENLVSRSQAKRLVARLECFKDIVLDFSNVSTIGQAFADEIFRVFQQQHPKIKLHWINTSEDVARMIKRAWTSSPELLDC